MRQKNGSKTQPWETPAVSLSYEEPCLFKRYYKTLCKLPDMIFWYKLNMIPSCQILSKNSFNLRATIKRFEIS